MIVQLEGLIGAGKTTLGRALCARHPGVRFLEEPVTEHGYLGEFYANPQRWAFPMQVEMLTRRARLYHLAASEVLNGRQGVVLDRGMPGDRVFASLHFHSGNINGLEWGTYKRLYETFAASALKHPSVLIYLDVPPEVALERVQKRGRGEESGLTLQYLEGLAGEYEDLLYWLGNERPGWAYGLKVVRIPWDGEVNDAALEAVSQRCGW